MDQKSSSSGSNNDGLSNELSSMTIDSSSKKKKKNICLFCLKKVEGLQGCSRCGTAHYCGKECQVKHWPVHKNSCKDSNTENSDEKLFQKGLNHFNQGSYRKAEKLFRKLLTNLKNLGKSDSAIFLETTKCLGNAYYSQGKYSDAEITYKQCLDKLRMLHQDDTHPDVLSILSNLAAV